MPQSEDEETDLSKYNRKNLVGSVRSSFRQAAGSVRFLSRRAREDYHHIFGETTDDSPASSSSHGRGETHDIVTAKSPSTKSPRRYSIVAQRLGFKTQLPQPLAEDKPRNTTEYGTTRSSPTRNEKMGPVQNKDVSMSPKPEHTEAGASSSSHPPAKSANDIEVQRSSPKPILARQNLPKPTFSSLEEYEHGILNQSVCSARPSRDNVLHDECNVHFAHAIRASQKNQDRATQKTEFVDPLSLSAFTDILDEDRSESRTLSARLILLSTLRPPHASEIFGGMGSNHFSTPSKTESNSRKEVSERSARFESKIPRLWPDNGMYDRSKNEHDPLARYFQQTVAHRLSRPASTIFQEQSRLKRAGIEPSDSIIRAWRSYNLASLALAASFPAKSGLEGNFSEQVCEPLNTNMSPPSSLDDILDGPFRAEAKLPYSFRVNCHTLSPPDADRTLESSLNPEPSQDGDSIASPFSNQDRGESDRLHIHPRKIRRERDNEQIKPASARKEPRVIHPSRSLDLCAGNSAELCGAIPDTSAEDSQRKLGQETEARNAMARNQLELDALTWQHHGVIRQATSSTDEELKGLPASRLANPGDTGEPDFVPRLIALSEAMNTKLQIPEPGWNYLESPNYSPYDLEWLESPQQSYFDFESFFENDLDPFPSDDEFGLLERPITNPMVVRPKLEATEIQQCGSDLERALQKRMRAAFADYGSHQSRDLPSRGFRQIEKADDVIATMFSNRRSRYRVFQPLKLQWQHNRWIDKTKASPPDQKVKQDSPKDEGKCPAAPSRLENGGLNKPKEEEEGRKDSFVG